MITLYGAEWCAPCHEVRSTLDAKNVDYVFVDVDEYPLPEGAPCCDIPVARIDGTWTVGKESIEASLPRALSPWIGIGVALAGIGIAGLIFLAR